MWSPPHVVQGLHTQIFHQNEHIRGLQQQNGQLNQVVVTRDRDICKLKEKIGALELKIAKQLNFKSLKRNLQQWDNVESVHTRKKKKRKINEVLQSIDPFLPPNIKKTKVSIHMPLCLYTVQ